MKFWLLSVWFGFMSFSALAQQDSTKTWQIRWAATSLLDFRTPVLQLGIQKNITPKWAIAADYGLSVYHLLDYEWYDDSARENFTYQKLRMEIKYARLPQSSAIDKNLNYKLYLGLEGLFIPERYNKQNDFFVRGNERFEYSFSRVKNNIYVACLKAGMEWDYNQKWVLDIYAGLGPRFIYVRHYNSVPGDLPYVRTGWLGAWLSPSPRDQTEGWHKTLHMDLGLKLGYYLW